MKVGGREVIFNESFLTVRGEKVEFEVIIAGQKLPVEITFEEESKNSEPVAWKVLEGKLQMVFTGWGKRGTIMQSLLKPFRLGVINDIDFGFNFSCTASGNTYQVHFMVMTGGDYEQ